MYYKRLNFRCNTALACVLAGFEETCHKLNAYSLVIKMVKKKSKTNRRGFVAIPFSTSVPLLTLADNVLVVASLLASAFGEDIFVISVDASWALRSNTINEGPLEVGYAHGDLSISEVQENLVAELTDPDDIIQRERARRPVRRVGMFSGQSIDQSLNDGVKLRTKIKFSISDGLFLNFWVKNLNGASLTTGAVVELHGNLYGRWQR